MESAIFPLKYRGIACVCTAGVCSKVVLEVVERGRVVEGVFVKNASVSERYDLEVVDIRFR